MITNSIIYIEVKYLHGRYIKRPAVLLESCCKYDGRTTAMYAVPTLWVKRVDNSKAPAQ